MDKCREEFEIEFSKVSNRLLNKYKTQNDNEKYIDNFVEAAFIGWNLSRESMKAIKLPPGFNTMCISTTAKNKIIRSITSAGYKVE